ncbi:MAG: hypothetical protein KHZ05_05355 [Oscillospiraceae bacterium]|nr:hypothetical protein [Oscillospiraceae bacterium]
MGDKTRVIIKAPGGRLRECSRGLAEYFGFRKRGPLERQWKYHDQLTTEIRRKLMEMYPDLGQFSIIYFENQPGVEIIVNR